MAVTSTISGVSRHLRLAIGLFSIVAVCSVFGGTLRLGTPVISNNQYTFPVLLQGDSEGVAALDFRLAYDPNVFTPVGAQSGQTALQAQKQVSSNIAAPGEFVVVMMGFNQNSVAPGEVVELVLEKIGEPADGSTILRIAEPTLATHVGIEVDSHGSGRTVRFDIPNPEANENKDDETPQVEDTTAEETPTPDNVEDGRNTSASFGGGGGLMLDDGPLRVASANNKGGGDGNNTNTPEVGGTNTPNPTPNTANPGRDEEEATLVGTTPIDGAESPVKNSTTSPSSEDQNSLLGEPKTSTEHPTQAIATTDVSNNDLNGEKPLNQEGRQAPSRYAILLLLLLGLPAGLYFLVRGSGK